MKSINNKYIEPFPPFSICLKAQFGAKLFIFYIFGTMVQIYLSSTKEEIKIEQNMVQLVAVK